MKNPVLVAIAGGSGSGKTFLAEEIVRHLPPGTATIIALDRFYQDLSHLPVEERARMNFDHPESLDLATFREVIRRLKNGKEAELPVYDFHRHTRPPETQRIVPYPVLILEGLFALYDAEVRGMCHVRIFVDTNSDTCLDRRIERDVRERGRTEACVRRQVAETVAPMYTAFVEPTRHFADVVLDGTGDSDARRALLNDLAQRLRQQST